MKTHCNNGLFVSFGSHFLTAYSFEKQNHIFLHSKLFTVGNQIGMFVFCLRQIFFLNLY